MGFTQNCRRLATLASADQPGVCTGAQMCGCSVRVPTGSPMAGVLVEPWAARMGVPVAAPLFPVAHAYPADLCQHLFPVPLSAAAPAAGWDRAWPGHAGGLRKGPSECPVGAVREMSPRSQALRV